MELPNWQIIVIQYINIILYVIPRKNTERYFRISERVSMSLEIDSQL